jgi:ATP-dependent DNA helicase RecG
LLMFAEQPQLVKPQFVVKAIRYPGNEIHATDYLDTEDFEGPLPQIFKNALAFVMRNLHKIQAGRGVNAPGNPEIPESVFEELLVNALVHRDYLVSAPIRLFIFDNRIEIISPGHLPNNLTVEKIRAGNANIRNPILVSYVAKGLLPYHGLGSGIKRALSEWPQIDFADDRDGCLFTAKVHRNPAETLKLTDKDALKVQTKAPVAPINVSGNLSQTHGARSEAQSRAQSRAQSQQIIAALEHKPLSMNELIVALGLKSKTGSLKRAVKELLDAKLVEYTIPEKPSSRLQQYRLTEKGQKRHEVGHE